MVKYCKHITLSMATIPIIQRMAIREKNFNFSGWVEEQLEKYDRKVLKAEPVVKLEENLKPICREIYRYGCPESPSICFYRGRFRCLHVEA